MESEVSTRAKFLYLTACLFAFPLSLLHVYLFIPYFRPDYLQSNSNIYIISFVFELFTALWYLINCGWAEYYHGAFNPFSKRSRSKITKKESSSDESQRKKVKLYIFYVVILGFLTCGVVSYCFSKIIEDSTLQEIWRSGMNVGAAIAVLASTIAFMNTNGYTAFGWLGIRNTPVTTYLTCCFLGSLGLSWMLICNNLTP